MAGLLEKLGLRRRNRPPPVVPPPAPDQQAQDIMYRAAAASRRARGIGSDLNGQRDPMRIAIETLAMAGSYAQATLQVVAFETLVNQALAWHDRAPDLAAARNEAQRLSDLGDGPAGILLTDLTQAGQLGSSNGFGAATALLDTTIVALARRTQAQPLIAQAAGHATRATQAGLDLAGQRDTLHQEIVTLADTDQFGGAAQKLVAFATLVDAALAWHGRAQELAAARNGAQGLKTAGDPTADTLLGELAQADSEAAANRYPAAGLALDTAGPKIAARTQAWPLIQRADVAAAKAGQAGIDLGGQRETLRKEIVDLAEAGQFGPAGAKATAFTSLVDAAIAWPARAGDLLAARATAQRLKSEGDAEADVALTDLAGAEDEAKAGGFPAAIVLLDAGKLKAEQRAQAWPLIVRAAAAAGKAATAGLDFNGTRETQRLEIVGLADANQFGPAESKTVAFEQLVDGAIAWPTRAGDIRKARTKAELLKSGGDPTADALLAGLQAAEAEATAGRYAQAMKLLDPAIQAIEARAPIWKLLRTHSVEMAKLKPRLDAATGPGGIPGRGVGGHALAAQWQAFDTARTACPDDPLAGAIAPPDLAGRRASLTGALNTLVRAYAATPVTTAQQTWGTKEIAAREKQTAPLFQKVKYVTPKTAQQERLLREFNALPQGGTTFGQLFDRLDAKVAKAEELLAAVRTPIALTDEKAYFGAYKKVRARIEAAIATTDQTEPTKTSKEAFDRHWTPFDTKLKTTDPDRFTDCLGKLPALTAAADLVLKPRIEAATRQIDAIGADTPGTPPVPATNAQRSARAVAASQIDPVILRQLPVEKKLAMLTGVRANGGPPAFTPTPNNANDPERKATRDIYAILELEEKFVAAEKIQQKALIDELIKDNKAELQRARDEWPAMTDEQKVKVMETVLKAHCKVMKFAEPKNPGGTAGTAGKAIVAKDTGRPTNNGGYEPDSDVININNTGKLYGDFELMMDLIIHENSHNMQIKQAARLSLPDNDSNKLTKDNTDPPYTQALMWQANYQPGAGFLKAYIKSAEDYASYQKQPLEDHSWQAGPKTARMLMKALAT